MADLETDGKQLIDEGQSIESEQFSSELDNVIEEEGEAPENETGSEKEGEAQKEEDADKEEEQEKKEEQEEEKAEEKMDQQPEIKVNGRKLVSEEGDVSVDINEELESGNTDDTSGIKVEKEDGEAAEEAAVKPADIFGTKTGASRISGESAEDIIQQNQDDLQDLSGKDQSEPESTANTVLDANMKTGAKRAISKPKRFLFATVIGFKRAKKGIGNFFKKTLPKAFQSGAKLAKNVLKRTPLAPMVSLIDKVIEQREKTRPERERKKKEAKEKKLAKWLQDQDEKRHAKEEKERLKKEKEELEAKIKAELKEKKRLEEAGKKPGFFRKMWNGIKTGVFWLGRKIKESKVAGFAVKTVKQLKEVFITAKAKIGGVLDKVVGKVSAVIEQTKDDFDDYSFEDRMSRITEEENAKKRKGEEVPEQDYRTRYLALTEELKGKLASVRNNIERREEIEVALFEMEGMDSSTVKLKNGSEEQVDRGEWTDELQPLGWESDLANMALDLGTSLLPFGEHAGVALSSLGKIGSEASRVDKYKKRKDLMNAIQATSRDELVKRMSRYAKDEAGLRQMEAGFDVALNIFKAAEGASMLAGMGMVTAGAKFANFATTGVKMLATASKKRSGVKAGIKDMLGGREGYYALKAKYKMHAPEMRRAVRDALGVATSEDAVTADKWELSHLMHERTKQGPMDKETERMVAEAGGTSEKKFDALQGAGSTIRRRFADRRLRMTA